MDSAIRKYQAMCRDPHAEQWLIHLPAWIHPNDEELVLVTRNKLQEQLEKGNRATYGHDDIVATTSFSLWSNMIRNNSVWAALSNYRNGSLIFGHDQKSLHKAFDDIRNLRNRAYHLEPIFTRHDLNDVYTSAVHFLSILEPRLSLLMKCVDRFPSVYDSGNGWLGYRELLFEHYGLSELDEAPAIAAP